MDITEYTPELPLPPIPNSDKPVQGGGPALFNTEQGDINRKAHWSGHLQPQNGGSIPPGQSMLDLAGKSKQGRRKQTKCPSLANTNQNTDTEEDKNDLIDLIYKVSQETAELFKYTTNIPIIKLINNAVTSLSLE
jgi:hypothetical protein